MEIKALHQGNAGGGYFQLRDVLDALDDDLAACAGQILRQVLQRFSRQPFAFEHQIVWHDQACEAPGMHDVCAFSSTLKPLRQLLALA